MSTPYLFYWNIDKFPYIIPSIHSIKYLSHTKGETITDSTVWFEIIYIISGKAEIELKDYSPQENYIRNLSKNSLMFLPIHVGYKLTSLSDDFEYLHIKFLFYSSNKQIQSQDMNSTKLFDEPIQNSLIGIRLPRQIDIIENNESFNIIQKILFEYKHKNPGYSIRTQNHLLGLILELLQENSNGFDKILEHTTHIGISSKYSPNTILPQNCELVLSNIQIWSSDPSKHSDSKLLSVFSAKKTYQLDPQDDSILTQKTEHIINGQKNNTLQIFAQKSSLYHIWMYKEKITEDLRPYKEHSCLVFYAKCNMDFSFGLVVYNHFIHQCINHTISITKSDDFTRFCINTIGTSDVLSYSSYVRQTIEYIEKNYKNKVSLSNISKFVNINSSYLSKIYHDETGETIMQYLTRYRVLKAKDKLKFTSNSIDYIAIDCGFYDSSHFIKTFSSIVGETPNTYRLKYQNQQ